MANYLNLVPVGLISASSLGDGYTISLKWNKAYPDNKNKKIAHHIYYSTIIENVYTDGIKYVSVDDSLQANIIDLTPGQLYFFSVRPVEYDPTILDLPNLLPIAYDNLRLYPYSLLRQDITEYDLIIPLVDVEGFPTNGIVKIGRELVRYLAVDQINKNLVLTNISQRGFNNTLATYHTVDGYDGYKIWDTAINFFTPGEDTIYDKISSCESRFEYPNFPMTIIDGYRQVIKDILSTDLTISDEYNQDFPMYDYAGYHRTDPVQLLNGVCVGSYIGGEMGCIDGYGNVNMMRGMTLQDHNNQRQEVLLSVTGKPAVLIKRIKTGITCACYRNFNETSDDRCPICMGTKFVIGYEQYFNPRRSDGRILVRPEPAEENLKRYEAGLESEYIMSVWTLTVPTIKNRDILVLFDMEGNEEFRYEVLGVNRNAMINSLQGGQKMRVQRVRKFDPIYQIRVITDTSMFPSKLNTTIGMALNIPPHTHEIVVNEKVMSVNQINQTTAVMQGHNHQIVNGVVQPVLGHTHTIIL